MAQEPHRNWKPEPSEPFFQEPNAEPKPRNRKPGTARTVPPPNRNRTEPNQGHPDIVFLQIWGFYEFMFLREGPYFFKENVP